MTGVQLAVMLYNLPSVISFHSILLERPVILSTGVTFIVFPDTDLCSGAKIYVYNEIYPCADSALPVNSIAMYLP